MIDFARFRALALAFGLLASTPLAALADPATDALGQCLVGQTTGNDRILLVRWMTFAFGAHPAVQDVVTIDAAKIDELNRNVGTLFTELITQRCAEQTKAAVASTNDPAIAMQSAFQVLGAAASQEALQSPEVNASITGFTQFIDEAAIERLMAQ